jgi:hypothetical protein
MAKIDFEEIRVKVKAGDYEISIHAFEQMRKRGIALDDLENAIVNGDIIERDRHAKPFPKCIFWGFTILKGESIHVVCSVTPESRIVTVYFPDEDKWSQDRFRRK